MFKSPCGGDLTKTRSVTCEAPSGTFFLCLGDRRPRKASELQPKTSHFARFWAQNARKTIARNIPESVANLFLCIICRLSQRLLNNASAKYRLGRFSFSITAEKVQNESPRIFRIMDPNFAPENAPNFPSIFRGFSVLCSLGNRDHRKITKNPQVIFNAKSPGKCKEKIDTIFVESRQSKSLYLGASSTIFRAKCLANFSLSSGGSIFWSVQCFASYNFLGNWLVLKFHPSDYTKQSLGSDLA